MVRATPKKPRREERDGSSQPPTAPSMAPEAAPVKKPRRGDPPAEVPVVRVPPIEAEAGLSREEALATAEPEGEAVPEVRVGMPPVEEVKDDVPPAPQPRPKEGGMSPNSAPRGQPSRVTAMNHGRLAKCILRRSSLLTFQTELHHQSIADVLGSLFTVALQMSNGLFVLWDTYAGSLNNCGRAQDELIAAKTWADTLAKELAKM